MKEEGGGGGGCFQTRRELRGGTHRPWRTMPVLQTATLRPGEGSGPAKPCAREGPGWFAWSGDFRHSLGDRIGGGQAGGEPQAWPAMTLSPGTRSRWSQRWGCPYCFFSAREGKLEETNLHPPFPSRAFLVVPRKEPGFCRACFSKPGGGPGGGGEEMVRRRVTSCGRVSQCQEAVAC